MRYWLHEVAGWLLLAVGLYLLYACYRWLLDPYHILEAAVLGVIGLVVFRGGLHLIKVAMAARVCLQAREKPTGASEQSAVRPPLRMRL
jgi:hypothetical protein